MRLTVNGVDKDVPEGTGVLGLLGLLGISADRVAVELNRTIIRKESYGSTPLSEGDVLEIVGFVGGG